MNKKKGFIVILFAVGVIVVIYPHVAQFINNQIQHTYVDHFHAEAETIPATLKLEKIKEARECNTAIFRNDDGLSDPFTEGYNPLENTKCSQVLKEGSLTADTKGNTTNIDTFATLEIPKLGLHIPILLGASDYALSQGIGQVEGSSLPVGGPNTHTVLAGHRGMGTKEMFRNLDELQPGDVFYIHTLDERLVYKVEGSAVILPHETDSLRVKEGKDLATLLTCHPYRSNTHRLVVYGVRR
ncbi:class C sortase [Allobacillus sp. GCM10007491]|uniref:Class C sortase n=1 Tax=Allobacillus saliphilus TaxID=2912308 RepID=A0A941HRG5_9BACI|nr:class C sortase [Allobacillus saliphilus]MBR7552566.1 class C sortase [Allobacillus saliphilus]